MNNTVLIISTENLEPVWKGQTIAVIQRRAGQPDEQIGTATNVWWDGKYTKARVVVQEGKQLVFDSGTVISCDLLGGTK